MKTPLIQYALVYSFAEGLFMIFKVRKRCIQHVLVLCVCGQTCVDGLRLSQHSPVLIGQSDYAKRACARKHLR